MQTPQRTIAESNNFIILDRYQRIELSNGSYQSEPELEKELIADLSSQGYQYQPDITSHEKLLQNLREQLQRLNNYAFTESEWERFLVEYLNNPSDGVIERTRKIHDHYYYDLRLDDGQVKNIYLLDKNRLSNNQVQVINQFGQKGSYQNFYDVTILVNGLPLVHIELKRRGVAIREAFNQIHRYSKESFNEESSLFKYLQIFVISNGTDTRYFANTTKREKNSFDFTINWAKADNTPIKDLKDFTATFFDKNTLLNVLLKYSVFDQGNTLLIMRPYQIAATERILWKINCAYHAKQWASTEAGGYIWHTTGSGKTLTSFKAARLATELDFVKKVFFVVDRKDLDYQTMKEYQRFSPDSVNGSQDTRGLKNNIESDDNKIIVTTIQKLNNLLKSEDKLSIYNEHVVFIFDEAHRSQFGEAQRNLQRRFKKYYQFGFTGTPIFVENALGSQTTASVFGRELHSYVITDAIRDDKVLKFKVDYNDVRPRFSKDENEQDLENLTAAENNKALLHPDRIREITQYILDSFHQKTHRFTPAQRGFNALFAVSSVEAAKYYYDAFKELQEDVETPLKVATIFSFAANEEQAIGEIADESFRPSAMNTTAKEFLALAIEDYNQTFGTSFGLESSSFENYYRDLAMRTRNREVDLLIVVGMFLTGFDAPTLNTLFVDKNLRYHGLIQAFSRTNRIYDATKTFGNIVCFRNLEQATIDAITLFGDKNTRNVVLEKKYEEYLNGFVDQETGEAQRGYAAVLQDLRARFPEPARIDKESSKKAFVQLFGQYLRLENILQNYDEFVALKDFQGLDTSDEQAVQHFKEAHYLTDEQYENMAQTPYLPERVVQDYKSAYNDIRDWLSRQRKAERQNQAAADPREQVTWDDVIFEVELLKSQEINLDYILQLIFEKNLKNKNKKELVAEIRRVIRSSLGNRAKEDLIVAFIEESNLDEMLNVAEVIDAFFEFAQKQQKTEAYEIIRSEGLLEEPAKRYMITSLKREYADDSGDMLNQALPKMSPLNPEFLPKKRTVFERISDFVEKFKGIGGGV